MSRPPSMACGLIPAHAGNTLRSRFARTSPTAHPRSRGEHRHLMLRHPRFQGSSPLTRGTPGRHPRGGRVRWLIPAHAGNTFSTRRTSPHGGAHPRSRGEHYATVGGAWRVVGSSPLTRGTPDLRFDAVATVGLIPAHAGNTTSQPAWIAASWAHPRSRGEHLSCAASSPTRRGSSPLTRGTLDSCVNWPTDGGLIPAHAGNTRTLPARDRARRAHPRSRGEHRCLASAQAGARGSSPLTRGTLFGGRRAWRDERLIPAHAGNTLSDLRFYRADRSDLGKP